jgi:LAO/AO transport system kinase
MDLLRATGDLTRRRKEQARAWLWSETIYSLENAFRGHPQVLSELPGLEKAVADSTLPPTSAARRLLQIFFDTKGEP